MCLKTKEQIVGEDLRVCLPTGFLGLTIVWLPPDRLPHDMYGISVQIGYCLTFATGESYVSNHSLDKAHYCAPLLLKPPLSSVGLGGHRAMELHRARDAFGVGVGRAFQMCHGKSPIGVRNVFDLLTLYWYRAPH